MKRYFPDRTCMNIIRLIILTVTLALIVCSYVFLSFIPILMWILIGVFATAGIFMGSVYLPIWFRNTRYCISKKEINKVSGCFITSKQLMRTSAVQYTTTVRTPFSKITGLNFLIFNAMGGKIIWLFLSRKDIDEILKLIERVVNQNEKETD